MLAPNFSGKESIMKNLETSPRKLEFGAEHGDSGAHQVIDRVADAVVPAVSRAAFGAHRLVDRISGTTNRVTQQLEKTAGQLKDREQRLVAASSGYVRENPFKSAGIAMAAGFLVGSLLVWYRAGRPEQSQS